MDGSSPSPVEDDPTQDVRDSSIGDIIGVPNDISDASIINGLWISVLLGTCLVIAFCLLQRSSVLYRYRLVAKHVRVKPPQLETHGFRSLIDWAVKTVTIGDVDFVQSAGLDALIMVKLCALGVQMFLPMCILGVVVLIPMYWYGGETSQTDVDHISFMRLTIANYPPASPHFWIHLVFIYIYMAWAMFLLRWHYHQYLTMRQHYLRKGDDFNWWRVLYEKQSKRWTSPGTDVPRLLRTLPLLKSLLPSAVQPEVEKPAEDTVKYSDDDEDDEPSVRGSGPPAPSALILKASSSARFQSDLRHRHVAHGPALRLMPTMLRGTYRSSAEFEPHQPSNNGNELNPLKFCSTLPRKVPVAYQPHGAASAHTSVTPGAGRENTANGGGRVAGMPLRTVADVSDGQGERGVNGGTVLRPPANLLAMDSERMEVKADQSDPLDGQPHQAGSPTGGPEGPARLDPSLSVSRGPIAEAVEPSAAGNGHSVDPAAAAALSPDPGRTSPFNRVSSSGRPYSAPSEVRLEMSGMRDDVGVPGQPEQDLEYGPELSPVSSAKAGSLDTSKDVLDPDARYIEWWAEFGRLRYGGVGEADHGAARRSSPGGLTWDENAISLSRPSVSHRKTVNAIDRHGQHVAVLAQHYTVLVMDVTDRSRKNRDRQERAAAHAAASATTAASTSFRHLFSMLPTGVRRWFHMSYGNQAAERLSLERQSRNSEENAQALGSPPRSIGTRSRASHSQQLQHKGSLGTPFVAAAAVPPGLPTAPHQSHRRTQSLGDAVGATPQPGNVRMPMVLLGQSMRSSSGSNVQGMLMELPPAPPAAAAALKELSAKGMLAGSPSRGRVQLTHVMESLVERAIATHASLEAGSPSPGGGPQVPRPAPGGSPSHKRITNVSGADAQNRKGSPSHSRRCTTPSGLRQIGSREVADHEQGEEIPGPRDKLALAAQLDSTEPAVAISVEPLPATTRNGTRHGGPVAEAQEVKATEEAKDGDSPRAAAACLPTGDGPLAPGVAMGEPVTSVAPKEAGDPAAPADTPLTKQLSDASTAEEPLSKWDLVREAVWDGRVRRLPHRSAYSVVSATFLKLFPDEFERAIPVIKHKEVDLLLTQADLHMAQYENAKKYEEVTGKELYKRIGTCGLLGERKRLRHYHLEQVNQLMDQVRIARRRAFDKGPTPSWFVFFRTQRAAAIASQCTIHAEDNRQFRVHPAPGPEEVNWPALWSSYRSRDIRQLLMRPLLMLVIIFPIGIFTGALMQLNFLLCPNLRCVYLEMDSAAWLKENCTVEIVNRERNQMNWDWYCAQENLMAKLLRTVVIGWLPSLLVTLWQGMILPLVFTFVVQTSRSSRSLSEADRAIAKNMFYFAVLNVFLGGVVGSTVVQGINSAIEKGPGEIFTLIGTYLPTSSNFFINYTMFRTLVALPLRMMWPHIGVRMYLIRRYLRFSSIITKREKALLLAPVSPRYGFEVGMVMVIFVIAFAFAVVSPLLLPLAVLFFAVAWLFWRWALLYVYVRKYEGGGTMWPFIFNCMLVCIAIFPTFTACVFVTKKAYVQAIILLITVPVIIIRFNNYCYHRFQSGLEAMPLEQTVNTPIAQVEPWVYQPPPLLPHLPGWNPDWSKAWQGWNMPMFYG